MVGLSLISKCVLIHFLISGAHGVKIQFFQHLYFTGLVWETNSTGNCNNIPGRTVGVTNSIRTDTCFIAYTNKDCKSMLSGKFMPGDIGPSQFIKRIWSVDICNEVEGGSELNLDITEYSETYQSSPKVFESYRNECSCVNVPKYVQNMSEWSIDNHHNEMLAYFEPDCSMSKWTSMFIPAGRNIGMHRNKRVDPLTNTTYKIQSLGPDPNSFYFKTSCLNSSRQVATETTEKMFENATEGGIDADYEISNQLQVITSRIMELEKNYKEDSDKINQAFAQLQHQFATLSAQIKPDVYDLYA